MIYTIKAVSEDVTIGTQTFTSTPINLVDITCLYNSYLDRIWNAISNNDVEVMKSGESVVNGLEIYSNLVNLWQNENTHLLCLKSDWDSKA